MKTSKRTKCLITAAALLGVGTIASTINDLNAEINFHIEVAQGYYNRSTDLEKYIYNTHGAETLAELLGLSVDTIREFGKYIYS